MTKLNNVRVLTANCYGIARASRFAPDAPAPLMGLTDGQMRCPDTIHNGGWYNGRCEKVGWGDLNKEDFRRIKAELPFGEAFVVLCEDDSQQHRFEYNCRWEPSLRGGDVRHPSVAYICAKALMVIANGKLYMKRTPQAVSDQDWLTKRFGEVQLVDTFLPLLDQDCQDDGFVLSF